MAEEEAYGLTRQQQQQCRGRVKPPPVFEQIRPFADGEIVALFEACNPRGWMGLRTRAIIALLLDTGVRASGLCGLTIGDVNLTMGDIHVRAVTSKVRRPRSIALVGRDRAGAASGWWPVPGC